MKKTRRGGLGRGLGALIQSTADTEESTQPSSSRAPAGDGGGKAGEPAPAKSDAPRRRTTSAAAAASEKTTDTASSADESTQDATSTPKKAGTSAAKPSGKTSAKDSSSTKKSTTRSSASGTSTAKSTSSSSGVKKTSGAGRAAPAAKSGGAKSGAAKSGAAKDSAAKGGATKTSTSTSSASKSSDASKKSSSGQQNGRPVDVFFSSDRAGADAAAVTPKGVSEEAVQEDRAQTSSSTSSARGSGTRKQPTRRTRPSMPAVSAPSRRSGAQAAAAEKDAQNRADAPVETTGDTAPATSSPSSADAPAAAGQDATVSTDIAVLRELKVTDIHPNPRQPREVFDEDHMDELVTSITEVGILQPVVVREVDGPTPYELIMGERRWRATQLAGLETIPAIVRHTPDEDLLRDALLENLHRSQLNPLEEAAAYQQLMDDFQCTQEELSLRIGRSRPQISNTLRLMKLPPLVQRRVANNLLTAGHARALLGLTDPAEMERLAQRIVSEGLSVRATEEAVALSQGVRQAAPTSRRRSEPTRHERLDYFATALTSRLDTQVKITLGQRKGKIAIDFASVEDLNRIMELIQGDDEQK